MRCLLCFAFLLVAPPTALSEPKPPIMMLDEVCLAKKTKGCVIDTMKENGGYSRSLRGDCGFGSYSKNVDQYCSWNELHLYQLCEARSKARFDVGENCARELDISTKIDALTKYLREDWQKAAEAIFAEARRAEAAKPESKD